MNKNNNPEIERLINELKPKLKVYLEEQGVVFTKGNQFHCFNKGVHAHADKKASASITTDGLGFICFTCGISGDLFKACSFFESRNKSGKDFIDMIKYLADKYDIKYSLDNITNKKAINIHNYTKETEYIYTDLNDKPLYKIVRMVNPENKKDKKFYPYMYDMKNNSYNPKSKLDCERTIYHLPEVSTAIKNNKYIFFVEGEKCVEILRELGLIATCINGGAKAWKKPHSNKYVSSLCNANIIILPDNDKAGYAFSEQVAKDVITTANSVKILKFDNLPEKGDIEQWLQLGGSKEKLIELANKSKVFSKEKEEQSFLNIYEYENCYKRKFKELDKEISNFIIKPHNCIEENGVHYFFGTIITKDRKQIPIEFSSEVFINKIAFKKAFQNTFLSFTGNDDDLQIIKLLISNKNYTYKKGVKYVGIHKINENYIFIGNKKSLTNENIEDESTVLMPQYKVIETSIVDNDIITKEELNFILNSLFKYNSLDKTSTIMGFLSSCFVKAHFIELGIEFPHLLIFGESGSGKTQTIEKVIKPFFSMKDFYSVDQLTPFTSMKICSSSNVVPFIIDEYKPRKLSDRLRNMISALLRNAYNNLSGVRGMADQSIIDYSLINPIILLGEEAIIETAIQERSLELSFGKIDLTVMTQDNFRILKDNQNIIKKLGKTLLLNALKINPQYIKNLYCQFEKEIKEPFQTRVINNICVCISGLALLEQTLETYNLSLKLCTGYSLKDLLDSIVNGVKENVILGSDSNINTVDATISIFDRMALQDKLIKNVDYTFVVSKYGITKLALDVNIIYDKFTKYIKEYNIQDETIINKTAFTKQLRKMNYFVNYEVVVFEKFENNKIEKYRKKAYTLDFELIKQKIELQKIIPNTIDSFNQTDEQSLF